MGGGMRNLGLATLLIAASVVACSKASSVPPQPESPQSLGEFTGEFTPSSRTQIDGVLLQVGQAGRIGVIDVQTSSREPHKIFAETILLQKSPSGSPADAISQLVEIDCGNNRHRIIANISYKRDGTLLRVTPVETSFNDFSALREVYIAICDSTYGNEPIETFTSISGFLDLFGPTENLAPPRVVRAQ
jgi:hypothetical protein